MSKQASKKSTGWIKPRLFFGEKSKFVLMNYLGKGNSIRRNVKTKLARKHLKGRHGFKKTCCFFEDKNFSENSDVHLK